jgi:phenylpropionate dioxygenase-like ring-hydroxylating dioxygenase large terminal subunit
MGILKALAKVRGGYPGGWREYARGYKKDGVDPFEQPVNPDDRRSQIPALGYPEYWYPAVPDKDIGWKKPVGLRLLGTDVTLFRDKNGQVQALWDYCPHRGVYLSWGDNFWKGYLSCAYHGATFDGDGECVEFITEGPDSKMVGQLKAKKFPTVTLKGLVFIWMGEGEPVPPEEDLPPEFFEGEATLVLNTLRYWHCNWMIGLENQSDSHNCFWVHRDSLMQLRSRTGGRARTPLGYRSERVNDKATIPLRGAEQYYFEDGKMPYKLYYPRAQAYWPLHSWRLLWTWFFEFFDKRNTNRERFDTPEEWRGMRLPGMHRLYFGGPSAMYTRWCVPVDKDLTRVVYFRSMRIPTKLGRVWETLTYKLYRNWFAHYNFSDQDYDAMRSTRYQYPEYLSATDSHVVAQRRLLTDYARGAEKFRTVEVAEETTSEKLVAEYNRQVAAMKPEVAAGTSRLMAGSARPVATDMAGEQGGKDNVV